MFSDRHYSRSPVSAHLGEKGWAGHLADLALVRGLTRLLGEFSATPNELVPDHYRSLGFPQIGGADLGHTCALSHFIR
jgi:hypothetical protein